MFQGTNASAGIGIGKAVIVEEVKLVIKTGDGSGRSAEVERFKGALDRTIKETEELAADLATRVGEKEAEIMNGHLMLLSDPMLTGEIENSLTVMGSTVNLPLRMYAICMRICSPPWTMS